MPLVPLSGHSLIVDPAICHQWFNWPSMNQTLHFLNHGANEAKKPVVALWRCLVYPACTRVLGEQVPSWFLVVASAVFCGDDYDEMIEVQRVR